jgi:4-amino-4-deoxychorismate lyase
MFLCFETIKLIDGKLLNLEYHQKRVDKTRSDFGFKDILVLKKEIKEYPKKGIYRLRVEYGKEIKSFTCKEYKKREIKTFKLVYSDISYEHKYSDRDELNALLVENYDDIIIVKNGLLCDTSIANIALYIDEVWVTPKKPLLLGTTRARLLDEGFLICADLRVEDFIKTEKFAIMIALIGFKIISRMDII